MAIITESAEYHYLNYMEELKEAPNYWAVLETSFSQLLDRDLLINNLEDIRPTLKNIKKLSQEHLEQMIAAIGGHPQVTIYQFSDYDILGIIHVKNNAEGLALQEVFESMKGKRPDIRYNYGVLAYDLYRYQNMIDEKFLSAKFIQALLRMTDKSMVDTISMRRKRRNTPVMMIVEDDKFTASYTAGLLEKEFEVVCVKNGEEALLKYIEHAPNGVFLDIRLPGIDGHQTLQAIRAIDPQGFVVMLSVDTIADNIRQACRHGADGFLKKPFNKERLVKTARKSPFVGYAHPVLGDESRLL